MADSYLQAYALSDPGAADIAATRKEASTLVCRLPTAFRPRQVVSIVSHATYSEKR